MTEGQYRIPGREILREVVEAYQPYRDRITEQNTRVLVIRFDAGAGAPEDWATRMAASQVSAEQKRRLFTNLGATADVLALRPDTTVRELADHLAAANESPEIAAVIVQSPPPRHLVRLLDRIAPEKDIDALGVDAVRTACATADGITRIAAPYLDHGASVAVVGSRGFVGSGVLRLLQRAGHEPVELDYGDDLRQVRDVDVIISTTGRAGLLHAEHLHRDHRLVIDSGFVPHPAGPVGDVHLSAAGLPRAVTPVPGGIGPVEMATLAERLVIQVAATELASWRYLALGREAETGLALHHKHTTAELTVAAERARAVEAGHERGRTREQDLGYDASP